MPDSIVSPWLAPGWWLAHCEGCLAALVPFRGQADRDMWAQQHSRTAGHTVTRVDPEELRPDGTD